MMKFRTLLMQTISSEDTWIITMSIGFLWLLISFLAFEAYKTRFQAQYGRPLQKPGILNRWSPNHAVSADMFRAKITGDMGPRIAGLLISYRVSVILFYAVMMADMIYLVVRYVPFTQ
jgi:hypothetical protein